jgi:hypothetical protein
LFLPCQLNVTKQLVSQNTGRKNANQASSHFSEIFPLTQANLSTAVFRRAENGYAMDAWSTKSLPL